MASNSDSPVDQWSYDHWLDCDKSDDDLALCRKGPSCLIYLQRHGYANGDDVRVFGSILPVAARRHASTVLRARHLSPGLSAIPEDLVVRHVLPFLIDDDAVEDANSQRKRSMETELRVSESLADFNQLRVSKAWRRGTMLYPVWSKFAFDMGNAYDQVVPIHAIYIMNIGFRSGMDARPRTHDRKFHGGAFGADPARPRRVDSGPRERQLALGGRADMGSERQQACGRATSATTR